MLFLEAYAAYHCSADCRTSSWRHHDVVLGDASECNLDGVGAVFFLVGHLIVSAGSLPGLHTGTNPAPSSEGEWSSDESAAFDSHHFCNAFVAIELREIPANHMQGARVFESRGKVLEQDAFGGKSCTSRMCRLMYSMLFILLKCLIFYLIGCQLFHVEQLAVHCRELAQYVYVAG